MDLSEFGPFATVVAVALALVATFSLMIVKAIGRVAQWSFLIEDTPPFLVSAGARGLAVALIAITFVTISQNNYLVFAGISTAFGVAAFLLVNRFEHLRRLYVVRVPLLGPDCGPLLDDKGQPRSRAVVIGLESEMTPDAAAQLKAARKKRGPLDLVSFMGGVVGHAPDGRAAAYDARQLWPREVLAAHGSKLTLTLMGIVLCGVTALYQAASVVEVAGRAADMNQVQSQNFQVPSGPIRPLTRLLSRA